MLMCLNSLSTFFLHRSAAEWYSENTETIIIIYTDSLIRLRSQKFWEIQNSSQSVFQFNKPGNKYGCKQN